MITRSLLLLVLALFTGLPAAAEPDTAKPWTRWWWLGSGVDQTNLTRQLEDFAEAGIGGVEICPIYGAKGYEDRDLEFLSPEWTAMLDHTSRECARLGLGMDLTTGTGWPFGGPWVDARMASHSMVRFEKKVEAGGVSLELPEGGLECLRAFAASGESIDLAGRVNNRRLTWEADQPYDILGIFTQSPIQKVKRAAPGGAGNVVDPFSSSSLEKYLTPFDAPLSTLTSPPPRAHFHDSFEYYGADWTPGFLDTFRQQHGYDFETRLPAFYGHGQPDEIEEITHDYRETLDLLHHQYLKTWNRWAKKHGSLTRNQAHGSPGNLLDHYAVADIPETEIFRHVDDRQIPMLQFAASAAHVTGKNLVSAESFTWLGEHFRVKPSALKEAADFLWLGGVNHIFFHGIPYTPEDAGWPGWLFYASTHMGENGGLWRDLPAFTSYIHTIQAELQSGRPHASVLLYWPVHDVWSKPAKELPLLTVHNQDEWLQGTPFHDVAMELWNNGIACDFVSDRMLRSASVKDHKIQLGGRSYDVLAVPATRHPVGSTRERLDELSQAGASVLSLDGNPDSGHGGASPLLARLKTLGIEPEPMTRHGLRFVRRDTEAGQTWFIVNKSGKAIDEWIPLTVPFGSALFLDPSRVDRHGIPRIRDNKIHFRLQPGESRILKTSNSKTFESEAWRDFLPDRTLMTVVGPWTVEFIEGGPDLPADISEWGLRSWTDFNDAAKNFSGTARYSTTFIGKAGAAALDLGEIGETCRASLNGRSLGASFFPPHRFEVSDLLRDGENQLEVEVTNLAANRIADADRRGVDWKAFHEINFVNIDYEPFDASDWKPLPSGLLGPVRIIGMSSD